MNWYHKPYVPVEQRRRKADQKLAALRKKGQVIEPVTAATARGRIAASFWGEAWCKHLESFSDFENRLPRGRSYLRNGSVLHVGIEPGQIHALVMGSSIYTQTIRINPLPKDKWEAVKRRCQGKIGSLVELLQGKLSAEIMAIVTDRTHGLFPSPKEIHLNCSCPDWAGLCKHLAAVLYGVGARLDHSPELLFKLRGVEHSELIKTDASTLVQNAPGTGRRRLSSTAIGDVFGIELDSDPTPAASPSAAPSTPAPRTRAQKKSARSAPTRPSPFQPTGAAVRALREHLNLSRTAFAKRLNVSAPSVANWESNPGPLNLQPRSLSALRKLHRSH